MLRTFYTTAVGFSLICISAMADPVLTLTPTDGTVSGSPGSTVGWGFTITNDSSSDYLLVSFSDFCESGQSETGPCSQALGTYNDFIANNGTLVSPGGEVNQSFDASGETGVGEYVINSTATPGQTDTGYLEVVYNLYSGDPFTDPDATPVSGDLFLTAAAEVAVSGVTTVPEPSLPILLGFGLAALAAFDAVSKLKVRLRSRSPAASH
jgi:hypothetical protein